MRRPRPRAGGGGRRARPSRERERGERVRRTPLMAVRSLYGQPRAPAPRRPPPVRVAGQCFDAACQAAQDRAFALGVLAPLAAAAAGAVAWARAKPSPPSGGGTLLTDEETGTVFVAAPGAEVAGDGRGQLTLTVAGYTPSPASAREVASSACVKVAVGPVGARAPRAFAFQRALPTPSRVLAISLPRPMGVVFAEASPASGDKRVVVDSLVERGEAGRRAAAASLNPALADTALRPGDLLRAVTATTFVFKGAAALAGFSPPTREVVLFGADGEAWPRVREALRRGDVADGDVAVVVVRAAERDGAGESAR